ACPIRIAQLVTDRERFLIERQRLARFALQIVQFAQIQQWKDQALTVAGLTVQREALLVERPCPRVVAQLDDWVGKVVQGVGDFVLTPQLAPQREGDLTRIPRALEAIKPMRERDYARPCFGQRAPFCVVCGRSGAGDEALKPIQSFQEMGLSIPEAP